jgi:single-strand DNA-binding protein
VLNKVVLIGRITKDIELRYTPNGVATANFFLAVQRNYKNQNGEYEADFIPIVVWRKQAESCAKYLAKGRMVAVAGRIQTRSYEQDGQRRYTWEVVADEVQFLDRGEKKEETNVPGFGPADVSDDELPF